MKPTRLLICACVTLCAVSLPSCSLFQKSNKEKITITQNDLPTDREQILIDKGAKTYNPEDLAKGYVIGDWAIQSVYGQEVKKSENVPYLKFVPEQKRMYGNNGCNTLNANYTYNPQDSTLSFSQCASTMRLCPQSSPTEMMINTALEQVKYYRWEAVSSQYFLYFLNADHVEVMRLMHQNFDFLNGSWRVTSIDGEALTVKDIQIVIDVEEGKIHGYTGCNTMNGTMNIDMGSPNSISFQAFTRTKMACDPEHNYEMPLLVALEEADTARPIGPDKVLLINTQGNVVLTLERIK